MFYMVEFGNPATKRLLKKTQISSVGNPSEINSLQIARRGSTSPITTKTFPAPIDRTVSQADNQHTIDQLYKLNSKFQPDKEIAVTGGRLNTGGRRNLTLGGENSMTLVSPSPVANITHNKDVQGAYDSANIDAQIPYSFRAHTHPTRYVADKGLNLDIHSAPPSFPDYNHATTSAIHPHLQTGTHKNYVLTRNAENNPMIWEYGASQKGVDEFKRRGTSYPDSYKLGADYDTHPNYQTMQLDKPGMMSLMRQGARVKGKSREYYTVAQHKKMEGLMQQYGKDSINAIKQAGLPLTEHQIGQTY